MNLKVMYMKKTDNWRTPKRMYDYYINVLKYIDLFEYQSQKNQYEIDYKNKNLFCNPPYSDMKRVTEYLIKQIQNDNRIVLLIPARTDTQYFHKLLPYCDEITFIKGRLKFNDDKGVAPFASILMYLTKHRIHKDTIIRTLSNDLEGLTLWTQQLQYYMNI